MIEKYFQLGVRYQWQKPPNVDGPRDGKIVDSIRPTSPLIYIGLGSLVSPTLMTTHVSMLGLQMRMPVQHQWLDYTERGVNYVGHVGTVESDPAVNRTVKRAFAFAMPPGTTGFNPLQAWSNEIALLSQRFKPPKVPQICALVTTTGEFYSVVMFIDGVNEWYCGGIKKVPPISHDDLKMFMLRVD